MQKNIWNLFDKKFIKKIDITSSIFKCSRSGKYTKQNRKAGFQSQQGTLLREDTSRKGLECQHM